MGLSNMDIVLKNTDWNSKKDSDSLYNMMTNEEGIRDIFFGRFDRFITASISWLIKANDENVGFINLVVEKANYNFLFLDMRIIKAYRGKGYGKKFLKEVQEIVEREKDLPYVLMETKKDNDSANGISRSVECYLTSFGDRNIYLLQKSKLQEFIDTDQMEKLAKHYEMGNNKASIIKEYL